MILAQILYLKYLGREITLINLSAVLILFFPKCLLVKF